MTSYSQFKYLFYQYTDQKIEKKKKPKITTNHDHPNVK